MVVGVTVETVEAQKLRFLIVDVACDLDADTLGGVAAAASAGALGMGRAAIQVPMMDGESNRSGLDSGLTDVHV